MILPIDNNDDEGGDFSFISPSELFDVLSNKAELDDEYAANEVRKGMEKELHLLSKADKILDDLRDELINVKLKAKTFEMQTVVSSMLDKSVFKIKKLTEQDKND